MAQDINAEGVREAFDIEEQDVRTYSPLTLAFLGDGVYELLVRSLLTQRGNRPVNSLNRDKTVYVRAEAQAAILTSLEADLSPEERSVFKRGRNAHSHTVARNASLADYRMATGFEALVGYLYLQGRTERLLDLVKRGIDYIDAMRGPGKEKR